MKTRQFVAILGLLAALGTVAFAQTSEVAPAASDAAAATDDDPVVVSVYGTEYRRSEVERLRRYVPAAYRANTQNMTNKAFVESFGFLQAMATLAQDDGFLNREPYRTQAQFNEITFLAQAYLQMIGASVKVSDADKQAFYDENADRFQEVQLSAIYINFTPVPEMAEKQGRPVVLESDAMAKAEELHAQLLAGADFAALAKEHSDDEASAAKGGDLGYFSPDDPLSDAIKAAVFRMDVGDTSAPVKDPGRIYLFRVTGKQPRPFNEVEAAIDKVLTEQGLTRRMDEIRNDIKIESTDQVWLETKPDAPGLPPVPGAAR